MGIGAALQGEETWPPAAVTDVTTIPAARSITIKLTVRQRCGSGSVERRKAAVRMGWVLTVDATRQGATM
jgi:hypothetical protein